MAFWQAIARESEKGQALRQSRDCDGAIYNDSPGNSINVNGSIFRLKASTVSGHRATTTASGRRRL